MFDETNPQGVTQSAKYFLDPEVHDLEQRLIFAEEWLYLAHQSQISNVGDFVTRDVLGEKLLLTRDEQGRVRTFYNVCTHRGCRLTTEAEGSAKAFRCPYHRWVFGLDGALLHTSGTYPDLCMEKYPLASVPTQTLGGLVFVALGQARPSLAEHVGDFSRFIEMYEIEELRCAARKEYSVAANWKLIMQNVNECLHFPAVHRELDRVTDYDLAASISLAGNCIGAWQGIREGFRTVSPSGDSGRRAFARLGEEDLRRVNFITLLPNVLFSFFPDYVIIQSIWPRSVTESRVVTEWFFHADVVADPGFSGVDVVELWDKANLEDWRVCQLTHEGIRSRGYAPGPYSLDEDVLRGFDRYVLSRIQRSPST